jgi:hypothetical protein
MANSWFECVWLLACLQVHKRSQPQGKYLSSELDNIDLVPFSLSEKEVYRQRAKEIFPNDTLGCYGLVAGQLPPTEGVKWLFQRK